MTASLDTLRRLAGFDTPTVSNAIELFEVRPRNTGYMDARIRAAFPDFPPMVGYALTTGFRSDAPPPASAPADVYGGMDRQVERFAELPGPAVVVFQDMDDPAVSATFGEVMCTTYQAFGAAGLVTSGAGRDLEQVRALKFPVFTNGAVCSHGYCHMLAIGLPVRVGGLTVRTGELLHADANGVLQIPLETADALPDVCAEFLTAEKIVLDYLRGPGPKDVAEFRRRREEFQAVIAELRARVRKQH